MRDNDWKENRVAKPLLELQNVSKSLDGKKVLDHISVQVLPNRVVGLAGSNGCGKSTLLKLMAGIWKADDGQVVRYTDQVSYLMPRDIFYGWMRVSDALRFYRLHFYRFRIEQAKRMLEEAGISQRTLLNRLSDGQRERVMLILALGTQAELYLLDEPVSGSDPAFKKEIRRFLMKYLPKDATILMATHLLRDFEQLFDQVIFLTREGLLQKEPEQLREMCGMSAEQYYLEVIGNGK